MSPSFDALPTIDFLSNLIGGTLNQPNHLAKSLRLWLILHTLYAEADQLPDNHFTSAQWRTSHYPQTLIQDNAKAILQNAGIDIQAWSNDYQKRYPKEAATLNQRLTEIPFDITDRTLRNDFFTLAERGWLTIHGEGPQRQYQRLTVLPNLDRPQPPPEITTSQLIPNELTLIADQFFAPINGEQRFILDIENVMSSDLTSQLNQFIQQLKQLWQLDLVPPIRIKYRSARRHQGEYEIITYPVCIHYCQRAPYLFGFGQTPASIDSEDLHQTDWYDYRLDHILSLTPITWQAAPSTWLPKNWAGKTLPPRFSHKTPQHVFDQVSQALGFEIYRPIEPLLLRFEGYFFGNYIEGTEREKLLTKLNIKQAERLFNAAQIPADVTFQTLFKHRPSIQKDIFCRVDHRLGDNNVVMRLRAWGHNVEVLLPWSLRERMREDLTKAQSWYAQHT